MSYSCCLLKVERTSIHLTKASRLDSLFEQLEPLRNYNLKASTYPRPDEHKTTNNDAENRSHQPPFEMKNL
jgi:hypothetical protein